MTIFVFGVLLHAQTKGFPKGFYSLTNATEKKERFTQILLPIIEEQNRLITKERAFIEAFFAKDFFVRLDKKLDRKNYSRLAKLASKYDVQQLFNKQEYLAKIDTIPNSMALGQAALESGWGHSYYAKELNNLFGHYNFTRKNIASLKVRGKKERIRVFDSLDTAVASYMLNLNTHRAYASFRKERSQKRLTGVEFSGMDGIKHLQRYSILGKRYIRKVRRLIAQNHFRLFDRAYTTKPDIDHYLAFN